MAVLRSIGNLFIMKRILEERISEESRNNETIVLEAQRLSKCADVKRDVFYKASRELQRNERVRNAAGI